MCTAKKAIGSSEGEGLEVSSRSKYRKTDAIAELGDGPKVAEVMVRG